MLDFFSFVLYSFSLLFFSIHIHGSVFATRDATGAPKAANAMPLGPLKPPMPLSLPLVPAALVALLAPAAPPACLAAKTFHCILLLFFLFPFLM